MHGMKKILKMENIKNVIFVLLIWERSFYSGGEENEEKKYSIIY